MTCKEPVAWHLIRYRLIRGESVRQIIRTCSGHLSRLAEEGDKLFCCDKEDEQCAFGKDQPPTPSGE